MYRLKRGMVINFQGEVVRLVLRLKSSKGSKEIKDVWTLLVRSLGQILSFFTLSNALVKGVEDVVPVVDRSDG